MGFHQFHQFTKEYHDFEAGTVPDVPLVPPSGRPGQVAPSASYVIQQYIKGRISLRLLKVVHLVHVVLSHRCHPIR